MYKYIAVSQTTIKCEEKIDKTTDSKKKKKKKPDRCLEKLG